jgi:hypothetical protein
MTTTITPIKIKKALIIELLKAKQEAKEGKLFSGDLYILAKC